MRRLIAMAMGILIGAGLMFGAFNYHLVRIEKKSFLLIKKKRADWHDAYADIRGWTSREWKDHAELSENLVAQGRGDLVQRSLTDRLFRGLFNSNRDSSRNSETPAK